MLNLLDKALLGIGLVEQAELGRGAHRPAGRLALGIALEEEAERELEVIRLLGLGQDLPGQVAQYTGLATQPRLLHLLELGEVLDDQLECGLGSALVLQTLVRLRVVEAGIGRGRGRARRRAQRRVVGCRVAQEFVGGTRQLGRVAARVHLNVLVVLLFFFYSNYKKKGHTLSAFDEINFEFATTTNEK